MCQLKYRWAALVIFLCLFSALWPVSSLAADGASIVEAASVSERMIVYVRGAGEVTGVTAMLGRYTGVTIHSPKKVGSRLTLPEKVWVKSSASYSVAITQDFIDAKGISSKQTRQGSHLIDAIASACLDIALYRRVITGVFFALELA